MILLGQLKQKAIKSLKNNWLKICLTIFIVGLLNVVAQIVIGYITAPKIEYIETVLGERLQNAIINENTQLYNDTIYEIVHAMGAVMIWELITVIAMIISFLFTLSVVKTYVYVSKGNKYNLKNVDLSFKTIIKSFKIEIVKSFYVLLWSLLFVIPGIIKMFAYSQAYLIQLENPDKKAIECLKESEQMMNGRKMEYFSFKVSFIGWYLVTTLIITAIDLIVFDLFKAQNSLIWIIVFALISYVIEIPIKAYMGVSDVFYYEALKEEMKNPRPFPFGFYNPQQPNNGQYGFRPSQPFENFGEEKEKGEEKDPFSDF